MATLTVSDTNPRVQYTATASQTVFAYGFPIFEDEDITAYQDTTLLTLTTDYTVSGAGTSAGGNVTLVTGATSGDIITIYRDLAVARSSDYQTGGDLLAETLNDDLDKLVMMVQQSEFDVSNRSIRFGQFVTGLPLDEITDNATDRANKVIGFDSTGQPIATTEIGNYQGDWATSTAYVTRDIIKDTSNNNIYLCNESHTSSGSQPISSNTDSGKWDLLVDAASATTSATNAATSATAAASSATSSASSATSSASSATTATTQASAASTSATAAASSATSAASSATSAAASFDSFDDVYLGSKSSAPTLDNDGDALQEGALYWNSATDAINVFNGSTWEAITTDTDTTYTAGDGLDLTGTAFSTDLKSTGGLAIDTTELTIDFTSDNSWSGSQRGTPSVVTDGTLDLDTANNFKYTPGAADTLEFSNETAGQAGFITLINPSAYTISLGSEVKKGSSWDVSTAGTYLVSYYSDGTSVYVSASEALS